MIIKYEKRSPIIAHIFLTAVLLLSSSPVVAQDINDAIKLNRQATELSQQGRYKEAIPYAEQALEIRKKALGDEHPDTARNYNYLARLYRELGNYTKAEPLYLKALEIRKRVLGDEHADTAGTYNGIAVLYRNLGDYTKAESLYLKALEIRKKVFGEMHADTAQSYYDLGSLYMSLGKYAKAEPLFLKALEIRKKALGDEHPDTAQSYNGLGWLNRALGNYVKAEPLYLKALEIYKKVLGEEHANTARTYHDLAVLYRSLGDYTKAEPLYLKALEIRKKVLGDEHPDAAQSYYDLGSLYMSLGNYAKAEPLYLKALDIRKKILGDEHPNTAQSYSGLGWLYKELGDYTKAEPLCLKALEIRKKALGEEHADTARSYYDLGSLYMILGKYAKAEPLFLKALEIRKQILGEEHADTTQSYNGLGWLYRDGGNYAKAEPLYLKALDIRKKVFGEENPDTAKSYYELAVLYGNIGDYAKAEPLYLKALETRKKILGEEHTDTARNYNSLARLYRDLGNYSKAEPLYLKALEIRKKALGEKHQDIAQSYNDLGGLYMSLGNYAKAEPLYLKALEIRKKVFGEKHANTAGIYYNLALLYLDTDKPDDAFNIFKRINSSSGVGLYHLKKGNFQEAETSFRRGLEYWEKRGEKESIIAHHIGLALSYEGLGNYEGAKYHFNKAIAAIEDQYKTLEFSDRISFLSGKTRAGISRLEPYEGMVRVLLKEKKAGYERDSLIYAERIKSRTFLEMLASRGVSGRKEDETVLRQDRSYQEQIIVLRKRLEILEGLGSKAPKGEKAEVEREFNQISTRYESFLQDVKLKGDEVGLLIGAESISISKIQSLLDPTTTLLEYLTAKDKVYAWLLTNDSINVYEMDLGVMKKEPLSLSVASLIEARVNDFLLPNISNKPRKAADPIMIYVPSDAKKETMQAERERNRLRFSQAVQDFHKDMISRIEKDIKTKNLIIVPHGVLHKVPFAALSDGKQYMADKYALSILPSASVVEYVVKKRKAAKGSILTMANPKTDYVPLDFAEVEGENISKLFPSREVYTLDKATESVAKSKSSNFNIIHFASHGQFNEKQPLQSGLLLAKDKENDGFLQVHEIFSLDLKNANLVTLSACETALSKIQGGDDLVGLSRGFIYAGTPSLLASLWEVDDKSTSILMESFYKNWLNGMSKPGALREAQLELKKIPQYSHPFYWAPFVMIGDWR
jgi:CHAT domain-containing protein/Tfp pilus assembly protein PilF